MQTAERLSSWKSAATIMALAVVGFFSYLSDRNWTYAAGMVVCLGTYFLLLDKLASKIHVKRASDKKALLIGYAACGFLLYHGSRELIPLIWEYIYLTSAVICFATGITLLNKWIHDDPT